MKTMRLSFVIPVYNVREYISECLESILSQVKNNAIYEIVLVNDGTPDNSKGFAIEPSIIINYDDCFTSNYNEFTCRTIGDFIQVDINRQITVTNTDVPKSEYVIMFAYDGMNNIVSEGIDSKATENFEVQGVNARTRFNSRFSGIIKEKGES